MAGVVRAHNGAVAAAPLARSTGAAADAAAAAEFAAKRYVWIPDKEAGYVSGWVVKEENGGEISVCSLNDGQLRNVPTDDLSKMNPPKFDKAEDIADLTFLNEASVVHNLRQRYYSSLIYTYSGLFLVAVNPYHALPIYTDAIVAAYKGRRREENAPHVFALADGAMRNMLDARENQSLLITGESGAGKTENTKKVIQYLAAIASDGGVVSTPGHSRDASVGPNGMTASGSSRAVMDKLRGVEGVTAKRLGLLERQILQANPILESFGNAQTIRNNNSSRFGKFVRIEFTSVGAIAGANIDWYLLEKSRVTNRSEKERSFHIFYQLLRSEEKDLLSKLLLTNMVDDYTYLKGSRKDVEGVDDRSEWIALREALDTVGFSPEEQQHLFCVVGAILQVGNIALADDRSEQARITNPQQVAKVCHVLGLPEQEFTNALLRPRVKAGREWVQQSRTRRQTLDEMAALCKTMYEKTFSALVDRINKALDRPTSKSTFIGVLDIAGFEIFETNSFEQLCINYTNEKLQQFFNHHMFVLEQEEYARENIQWDFVNFGLDLQPTIDLIESVNPIGILSTLDEECIMPKASDLTFTEKLDRMWGLNKDGSAKDAAGAAAAAERGVAHGSTKYLPTRFAQGFTIKHYAGNVEYRTTGWLDKNKDPLNDHLTRVMSESTDRFIAGLFSEYAPDDDVPPPTAANGGPAPPKRRIKRGAFRTVAQRHKEQLTSLMAQLGATQPHFVRCIVPNQEKKPGKLDAPLVLEQLRCNGVLEGIRIARLGYPNRLLFSEFRNRYEVLTPMAKAKAAAAGYLGGEEMCKSMVAELKSLTPDADQENPFRLEDSMFKIGISKIFFKAGVLAELEAARDKLLSKLFTSFQAAARMYTARRQMRKILNRAAAVRTIQRNARLYAQLRDWPWWPLYTKMRPLLGATRHDEELKRKELELALITERAERDQKEREALETLKFQLENEKRKVEEELQAERSLMLDKDQLLARSKERESALEDDLVALEKDVTLLDDQLSRALAAQKSAEASHAELKVAFDAAAEHLVRLESEQKTWKDREVALTANVGKHSTELQRLQSEQGAVAKEKEELQRRLVEREEDLHRAQQRMAVAHSELEKRLAAESQAREAEQAKVAKLEQQSRQSSQQLSELSQTTAAHDASIKKKEGEIAALTAQLATISKERDASTKSASDLKLRLDTLTYDLNSARQDGQRAEQARAQIEKELDETRKLMEAKSSEDVKQKEVQRMKEQEVQSLRQQISQLQDELARLKHSSLEQSNALKAEVEAARKQHADLSRSHADVSTKVKESESKLVELAAAVAAAEKAKRLAEGELQSVQDRAASAESSLAAAQKARDSLERDLLASNTKRQDLEDSLLELERSSGTWKQQAEYTALELSAESKRRELVESAARSHERSAATAMQQLSLKEKDHAKLKGELATALAELKRVQSMQNKTIVEHVHVLEEAKKYTDRQLLEAQGKLQELAHYTKTLEKSKARLLADNEDLNRQVTQLSSSSARAADKGISTPAASNAKLESQLKELKTSLLVAQRERDEAKSEARKKDLQADGMLLKVRAEYEGTIKDLRNELRGQQNAHTLTYTNLQDIVKRSNDTSDGAFRRRLLDELRTGHDELSKDISAKADLLQNHQLNGSTPKKEKPLYVYGNIAPRKSIDPFAKKTTLPPASPVARFAAEDASRADKRAQNLELQLNALELQVSAGQRVRSHLESQVREMTADMEAQGGSRFSLDSARRKLADDNRRLGELLRDEEEARKSAEVALLNGEASLRREFQERLKTLNGPARDEEIRKTMISQQREATVELQRAREELLVATRARAQLEGQVAEVRQRLDRESLARNEEAAERQRVQMELQELRINSGSSSHSVAEARDAFARERAKAEEYLSRLQQIEMDKIKAQKSAELTRLTLADTERALSDSVQMRKAAEDHIDALESQLRELQARFASDGRDFQEVEMMRQRLMDEFESERRRYKTDIAQREEVIESSRRRFQQEMDNAASDVEAHRSSISELREDNRRLRAAAEDLQLQLEHTASSSGGADRERQRLEGKLADLTRAYTESLQAQRDGQAQTVGLLAQIRDLRAGLDESELKFSQLQAAYTNLCQDTGVDESMIDSLERAVARYRAQADSHLENWRRTTQELEQQTAHLRQATLRRPGSIAPDGARGSISPSRMGTAAR